MSLREAVFKIQGLVSTVNKDGYNPETKKNFASLKGVLDVLNEPLQAEKLTITQYTKFNYGQWVLTTEIRLTSKDEIESFDTPLLGLGTGENAMQALGSAISYARRYSLLSYFKLAQVDDDGVSSNPTAEPALEFVKGKKADTKAPHRKGKITPVDHKVGDGKYKGKFLSEIPKTELTTYIQDIEKATSAAGKKHPKWFLDLKQAVNP